MTDLSGALQSGVYAALAAGVTSAPVKSSIKAEDGYPFVFIGEDVVEQIGAKGDRFERHSLTINTMDEGSSRRRLLAIQEEVRAALDGQALTAAGAILSSPVLETSHDGAVDESTFLGAQTFTIFVQPA